MVLILAASVRSVPDQRLIGQTFLLLKKYLFAAALYIVKKKWCSSHDKFVSFWPPWLLFVLSHPPTPRGRGWCKDIFVEIDFESMIKKIGVKKAKQHVFMLPLTWRGQFSKKSLKASNITRCRPVGKESLLLY